MDELRYHHEQEEFMLRQPAVGLTQVNFVVVQEGVRKVPHFLAPVHLAPLHARPHAMSCRSLSRIFATT